MSNFSPEEFLNKRVKIIFEPIISRILVDKPKDPVRFINLGPFYDWLVTQNIRKVEWSEYGKSRVDWIEKGSS